MHCDVALFYHRRLSPYTTVYTHCVYVCTYLLLSLPIASFHPFRPQRDRCALGRAPLASLHTPFLSYNRLYALSSSIRRSHSDLRRSIGLATDSQLFSAIVDLPKRSRQWMDRLANDIRRRSRGPLLFSKFPNFRILREYLASPFSLKKADACAGELSLFSLAYVLSYFARSYRRLILLTLRQTSRATIRFSAFRIW